MYKIVFSATGRTDAVADIICTSFEDVKEIDLSQADFENIALSENDLCVVAVPVYGGRVPAPAADNIRKISANGAKAVLAAVYGNRAFDDTLAELKQLCVQSGFVCVAACAAVAQHSIIPHVAADRPDENDKKELQRFAQKINELYKAASLPIDVKVPGNIPQGDAGSMPLQPKAGKNCVNCGKCAAACPAVAIPASDPSQTDKTKCITCMRCVEICPAKARTFAPALINVFGPVMKKVWGKHTSNEFFINK